MVYENPEPGSDSAPGMPRWVKLSLVLGAIIAVAVVAVLLLGGGQHGPARHSALGDLHGHRVAVTAPQGAGWSAG